MRINKNNLPVKYALEVYKMVEGYPSTIDLLYEIVSILQDRDKLMEPFTSLSMMKEVPTRIDGKDLEESLKDMVAEGYLSSTEGGYQLLKHPWT